MSFAGRRCIILFRLQPIRERNSIMALLVVDDAGQHVA